MYLARWRKKGEINYTIRQSYFEGGKIKSRDVYQLGTDPASHIVYVGGNGYYYDDEIQEALDNAGLQMDQNDLDELFFEFLTPRIQRVIHGFDRRRRHCPPVGIAEGQVLRTAPSLFDKRRYHYLRFGHSDQRHIERVQEKIFRPLHAKSRDELEQYFMAEEQRLKVHERASYVAVIFELSRFIPDHRSTRTMLDQLDEYFVARLCRLNADERFWAGLPAENRLRDYLIRYAIMYFDYALPQRSPWQAYVEDFIRHHRTYHPPQSEKIKLDEAGRLFGRPWKELEKLDRSALSRLYRQLALKYHPDQGGDPDLFRRLSKYYKVLSSRARR